MVLWALLMGVVHCHEGFFSLTNYRDAPNWTYGEVTKRLKYLATLIHAREAGGYYIKEAKELAVDIVS